MRCEGDDGVGQRRDVVKQDCLQSFMYKHLHHSNLERSCHIGIVHDFATLSGLLGRYAAVFLSPVFPSISKQGYRPKMALASIAEQLARRTEGERKTEVIALGGVTPANAASCAELGFDGVAVLGAIWLAEQPLKVFEQLQQSITTYAAGTS